MSEITSPIRSLLKNNVQFQWLPEHSLAFDKIKEVVMSDPVLQFYDPNKAVTIQCDASKSGLGASLLQEGRPVAYASRSLTDHCLVIGGFQIEKELLSIVFAAERFNQFKYGREVEVENDHKPLETIVR